MDRPHKIGFAALLAVGRAHGRRARGQLSRRRRRRDDDRDGNRGPRTRAKGGHVANGITETILTGDDADEGDRRRKGSRT